MADVQIGTITHYFDKIGVAVVEVKKPIHVGEKVKISGHDKEFEQEIASMQMEHEQVKKAKKGDSVGLKVSQPVKSGDVLYRLPS